MSMWLGDGRGQGATSAYRGQLSVEGCAQTLRERHHEEGAPYAYERAEGA